MNVGCRPAVRSANAAARPRSSRQDRCTLAWLLPARYHIGAMVSQSILDEICRRLVEGFAPQRIILFGSQARGTADDRSDVDLLVIGEVRDRKRQVLDMDRSLRGLGIARDIVLLSPEEFARDRLISGTVARPADLEGVQLYGA